MTHPHTGAALARRRARLLGLVLSAVAAAAALAWLAIALVHLDDRERVGHVQGAWMSLARYLNDGVLYPPVFDGERYGGTRWMPLGIVLHAGAARLAGGELVGGKALTVTLTVLLAGLAVLALRRLRCPWPVAAALVVAVLASSAGLFTTTTVGGDVLPVALQVGALILVITAGADPPARRLLVAAGVLAGLAPLAKLTAGWALLAILSRLAATGRWRALRFFLSAAAGTLLAGVAVALVASGGRLWDSVGRFAFAGGTGLGALARAPNQVVHNLAEFAPGVLAVLPLALAAVLLARSWRGLSVSDWALLWAVLALLVAYTDIGTGLNQLLDVLVLGVLVAAQLPDRLAAGAGAASRTAGTAVLALAAAVALGVGAVVSLVPALRTAADVVRHGHPLATVPLADDIAPGDTLLSEDPYAAVAHGRHPVVLDAFMVRRLDELEPELIDPLIAWIEAAAFDHILLLEDLERADWWERYHFGPRVADAIRHAYRPAGVRDGYLVYRPRS
jgi:hypothetical protein